MTVKIKPLVWVADEDDPDCIRSGDYWIYHQGLGYQVYIWPVVFGDPHKTLAAAQEAVWQHHVAHILAAIEAPDHLALVAAAYRDAVTWLVNAGLAGDAPDDPLAKCLLARTPADAEGHLTALLRAEYERGKAETQQERDLVEYVLQDDKHNRLTPRVVDIAYSAFHLGRSGENKDDGGPCDWFTDTRPMVMEKIAKIRAALALLTQEGR